MTQPLRDEGTREREKRTDTFTSANHGAPWRGGCGTPIAGEHGQRCPGWANDFRTG